MASLPVIALCLKPVRRSDLPVRFGRDGRPSRENEFSWVANPADKAALQAALDIRERDYGGKAQIIAWCCAPANGDEILRYALACGVDAVRRIWPLAASDAQGDGSWIQSTRAFARLLSLELAPVGPQWVITGDRSQDNGSEAFGAFLAHELGVTFAHRVVTMERHATGWDVQVRVERGYRQVITLTEPAVISIPSQGPHPPDPGLPAWIESRRAIIPLSSIDPTSLYSSPISLRAPLPRVKARSDLPRQPEAEERISHLMSMTSEGEGITVSAGTPASKADAILSLLVEKGYVEKEGNP